VNTDSAWQYTQFMGVKCFTLTLLLCELDRKNNHTIGIMRASSRRTKNGLMDWLVGKSLKSLPIINSQ
jgi:hypothetical protein